MLHFGGYQAPLARVRFMYFLFLWIRWTYLTAFAGQICLPSWTDLTAFVWAKGDNSVRLFTGLGCP